VNCLLVIRPEAEADLAEGFGWYERRRSGLGHDFLNELKALLTRIEQNPMGHTAIYRNVRMALVRRYPYKVLYLFEANTVEVIGVVHAKRQPRFWQERI
jgi:plasmid stabilization system protein ParE